LGFIIVSKSFNDPLKGDKISSIFAIIGFINIPIIKFSVDIWTTLHQPATISKFDTPSIHIDMLIPLLVMFVSFIFLFLYIFSIRFFSELNLRRYVAYTLSSK
jgi:ABC-type transport system involved in cytochrome c biogenesis, permease component